MLFVEQPNPWKLLKAIQELGEQIKQLQAQISALISGGEINATILGNNYGVVLDKDTIGKATILINETVTRVIFEKEYDSEPIVTITPIGLPNYFHGVINVSPNGFTIKISESQEKEIVFNWHAFGQVTKNKVEVINETISNKIEEIINKTNPVEVNQSDVTEETNLTVSNSEKIVNDSVDNIEEEMNKTLEKPVEEIVEIEDSPHNLTEEELALLNS